MPALRRADYVVQNVFRLSWYHSSRALAGDTRWFRYGKHISKDSHACSVNFHVGLVRDGAVKPIKLP